VPLSSIFSFDTLQARYRLGGWFLILVGLLAGAESLLRVPVVAAVLPPPETTLWHSELIQPKLEYLQQFEAAQGVDILFIGNSTMQAGLDPKVFDDSRAAKGAGPGSFNAAIEGLPPYGTRLFVEIFLRYTKPKALILGLSPQDLNSNSPWAADITDRVRHSPLALAEAQRGARGRLIETLLDRSFLYRYRLTLFQWLLRGGQARKPAEVYFDQRGYHPLDRRLADIPANERGVLFNRAGVLNYSTEGLQKEALLAMIDFCQENGIDLILVNMPLADDYYYNFDDQDAYQNYLDQINRIAASHSLPLWDFESLPEEEGFTDEDFADLNHLNREGAEHLSQMIAAHYQEWVDSGKS
jgi:hypothetical protein